MTEKITVVGGGYVGLPLAVVAAEAGYEVWILERDPAKVIALACGNSYIADVPAEVVRRLVDAGKLKATTLPEQAYENTEAAMICVPTPLQLAHEPDISFVMSALDDLRPHVRPGMIICLESTVYPGFTREVLAPTLLHGSGLEAGKDVYISFSPERVDPRNTKWTTKNTPKVVGGLTPKCCEVTQAFYRTLVDTVVPVGSTDAAELTKLLENTYRAVNIALVNEFLIAAHKIGIDIWEVIRAAATKPFGFQAFWPGPGVGGHCIAPDPEYLNWRLKTINHDMCLLQTAQKVNRDMPIYVVDRLAEAMNDRSRPLRGQKVLVVGVAYKPDMGDTRESPAIVVIEELKRRGCKVNYVDRFVPKIGDLHSLDEKTMALWEFDAAIITTHHSDFPYEKLVSQCPLVLDTRGVSSSIARL